MPEMWLQHHIDFLPQMEHNYSEFKMCSLRMEIAACHHLKAPFQPVKYPRRRTHTHPLPVTYVNTVN